MMKAVIVNCFDTYEDRIDLLHEFFKKKGYDISVIQSDFRHFMKIYRNDEKTDFTFVKSKPYYKNLSIARLTSHYEYAAKAFKIVEKMKPDLLYVIVPPNSLAKFAAMYKKEKVKTKLIFDIIDLWPETMPVGSVKKFPPFTFWRGLRDNSLIYADMVITECNLYRSVLSNVLKDIKTETVYLAKRDIKVTSNLKYSENQIHLCYLGSINSIIDIPMIVKIIDNTNKIKPVTLHIIGDGESKDIFINKVKGVGAKVEYYGKVYDAQKKQDIFDKCYFGLNIMKKSVCVGLTMKSIDYFQQGLPILNNIQADTDEIVKKYNAGFNITNENMEDVCLKIANMSIDNIRELKSNSALVFRELFSVDSFDKKLETVIECI